MHIPVAMSLLLISSSSKLFMGLKVSRTFGHPTYGALIRNFAVSHKNTNKPKTGFRQSPSLSNVSSKQSSGDETETVKDRPFTLPPGLYRPKQSLGQNFLSDQNYVMKIVNAFSDTSEKGCRVHEIGPGAGALTRKLYERYPNMTAIELDERGVKFLREKLPGINVVHMDVLKFDWAQAAADNGGPVSVIANLPYSIVSQVLFGLADEHKAVSKAVVTMQLEVAQRIVAQPNSKEYGILSVAFQLYAASKINFHIPPKVFYPVPAVDSALVTVDFTQPHKGLHRVDGHKLRKVISLAFQQRRKMMRKSLKDLCQTEGVSLPAKWSEKRPEQLRPDQFVQLTADLFGELPYEAVLARNRDPAVDLEAGTNGTRVLRDRAFYESECVWRRAMFVDMHVSNKKKARKAKEAAAAAAADEDDDEDDEDLDNYDENSDDWEDVVIDDAR